MSFYKRRAIRLGPVRLSLTRWGLGLSFARAETRLALGPRSTYVQMDHDGLSYRQRLDAHGHQRAIDLESEARRAAGDSESRELATSSSREIISQINARAAQHSRAPLFIVLAVIALPITVIFAPLVTAWVFGVGLALVWLIANGDRYERTTDLVYDLSDEAGPQYAQMQAAFQILARAKRIWLVQQEDFGQDSKRNGGASSVIVRTRVKVRSKFAPCVNSNVKVWSIDLGKVKLIFLPDRLLLWDGRKYRAIAYEHLGVAFAPTRFIERKRPPADSRVVDHTWRYVDPAGNRDPRYTSNKQVPMMLYGSIIFGAQNQLLAHLHVSSVEAAERFAADLRASTQSSESRRDSGSGAAARQRRPRQAQPLRPEAQRPRVRGTVKWFSVEKGYGFLVSENGKDVPVQLTQILADGLRSLPEGSVVEFEIARGAQGPTAVNIALLGQDQTWSGWRRAETQVAVGGGATVDAWKVLELNPNASDDDITAAYRRMAQMYHPDKVTNLGAELQQLADRKMKEINAAYELLKRR
jgi:cold shock CspA family protein